MVRFLREQDIATVAKIHQEVLPESPLVKLGYHFLKDIYYPCLLQQEGVFCFVYPFQEELTGFICGAYNTDTFSRQMLNSRLLKFSLIILQTLLRHPTSLSVLIELIQLQWGASPKEIRKIPAQLLSFGICPQFRGNSEFSKQHKIKISDNLFQVFLEELHSRGISTFKVITHADSTANFFYKNRGMRFVTNSKTESKNYFYVGEVESLLSKYPPLKNANL